MPEPVCLKCKSLKEDLSLEVVTGKVMYALNALPSNL